VLNAVSLSSAQFNLGRVIGPVLAAVAISVGSVGACFALNAVTFFLVIVTFAFVRSRPREKVVRTFAPLAELAEGARAAFSTPACRYAILGVAAVGFTLSPFITLVPAMAIHVFHHKEITAWLVAAQGVGAVIGALTLPSVVKRTNRHVVLRGSLVVLVLAILGYGAAPTSSWAIAALVIVGMAYIGTLTGLNTSVQLHAPPNERSRVLALYTLSLSIGYPVGALVQGYLADHVGVREVTVVSALVAAVGLTGILSLRPHVLRAIGVAPVTA
jgi:predicted MFS family arabinose efflux permease